MKKASRFVMLTAVMAVTASLAVPAFAASEDREKEATPSFFATFNSDNNFLPAQGEVTTTTPQYNSTWNLFAPASFADDDK